MVDISVAKSYDFNYFPLGSDRGLYSDDIISYKGILSYEEYEKIQEKKMNDDQLYFRGGLVTYTNINSLKDGILEIEIHYHPKLN